MLLNLDEFLAFLQKISTLPNNATLVVAGDFKTRAN